MQVLFARRKVEADPRMSSDHCMFSYPASHVGVRMLHGDLDRLWDAGFGIGDTVNGYGKRAIKYTQYFPIFHLACLPSIEALVCDL